MMVGMDVQATTETLTGRRVLRMVRNRTLKFIFPQNGFVADFNFSYKAEFHLKDRKKFKFIVHA